MDETPGQIPEVLQRALRTARVKHIPRGQILLYADDTPGDVYILKSGTIKIYDTDEQGGEKILHLVTSPTVIPFTFFSGTRGPLEWLYAALTECEVYVVPAAELTVAMRKNAELNDALAHTFSYDIHDLLTRLSSLNKTTAHDKVVAALRFLASRHATQRHSGWWRLNFPISKQLLADFCGISREGTTRVMRELETAKIVRHPKLNILEINKKRLPA